MLYSSPKWSPFCTFSESGDRMLRISASELTGERVLLRLEGQISARWVTLLEGTCEAHLKQIARVTIDLRDVSFADREGITLLRTLTNRGVEILNAASFIAEQIKREG